MLHHQSYRVLSPEGRLSGDTYLVAAEQPEAIEPECFLVVNERTGGEMTIHGTRLIPAQSPQPPVRPHVPRSVCFTCGKVEGVADDQVRCHGAENVLCALVASDD